MLAGLLPPLTAVPSAFGLITATLPLSKFLDDAKFICTVKVETIDTEKLGAVLVVEDDLKGKFPVRRLLLNLKGDSEAKKYDHTKQLLKRMAPRMTIVLFVGEVKGQYSAFAYSNGTWFHLMATKAEDARTVFAFTHCEPYAQDVQGHHGGDEDRHLRRGGRHRQGAGCRRQGAAWPGSGSGKEGRGRGPLKPFSEREAASGFVE